MPISSFFSSQSGSKVRFSSQLTFDTRFNTSKSSSLEPLEGLLHEGDGFRCNCHYYIFLIVKKDKAMYNSSYDETMLICTAFPVHVLPAWKQIEAVPYNAKRKCCSRAEILTTIFAATIVTQCMMHFQPNGPIS